MTDPNRQTGQTREQLRACRKAALKGEKVLYVVHTRVMVDYARSLLLTLGEAAEVRRGAIMYDGGGSVHFVFGRYETLADRMRGSLYDRIVFDHAYWSLTAPYMERSLRQRFSLDPR